MYRQQVFVLFVSHDAKHADMAEKIRQAVLPLSGVSRVGVLINGPDGGTQCSEEGTAHNVLSGYPAVTTLNVDRATCRVCGWSGLETDLTTGFDVAQCPTCGSENICYFSPTGIRRWDTNV